MAHHASRKVYSLHPPEVECIGKGEGASRYAFGVKVSIAAVLHRFEGWAIAHAKARSHMTALT